MGNMFSTQHLKVNDEGIIDLRRNPPATRVQVQGGIEAPEPVAAVDVVAEPPAPVSDEPLPGRQKTTEGLEQTVAAPVKVPRTKKPVKLMRISSSEGPECYAIVTEHQWKQVGKYAWIGTRTGHLARKVIVANGTETIRWLHRDLAKCNRVDQFVGFKDMDERNLTPGNLLVFNSKDELKAFKLHQRTIK